ncbi:hypothetical protein ABIB42_001075 [Massilia sp. UYP32]|uniref:hypothetical protein n=1 Tax=Massilia sp. UYP32 TaxID=1756386 RepID=UPI003D241037
MDRYYSTQFIAGVVFSTTIRKQQIGQRLAEHLSFIPGPAGPDGSVDGAITDIDGVLLGHFQSKLSSTLIDLNEGKNLHSDLVRLQPKVCVYVAGVGYQDSFRRLIIGQKDIAHIDIHLLTLNDVFLATHSYQQALAAIPVHSGGAIDFSVFKI